MLYAVPPPQAVKYSSRGHGLFGVLTSAARRLSCTARVTSPRQHLPEGFLTLQAQLPALTSPPKDQGPPRSPLAAIQTPLVLPAVPDRRHSSSTADRAITIQVARR